MGENSKIEWTDHTFNPWIGCTKVDELCAHCYAETQDKFRAWTPEGWGKGKPRKRTSASNWRNPVSWDKQSAYDKEEACATGYGAVPNHRVFCASLADWLDDDGVPIEWLRDMLNLVRVTQNLDWLLLTKRPQNWESRIEGVLKWIESQPDWASDDVPQPWQPLRDWLADWLVLRRAPENVWIGTSVGTQKSADKRIPELFKIPARVRFLSCEPLLEQVTIKLEHITHDTSYNGCSTVRKIDWLIAGSESGSRRRNQEGYSDCARSLRDQCKNAGVRFFHKQMPISGNVSHNMDEWPEDLRIREFPL